MTTGTSSRPRKRDTHRLGRARRRVSVRNAVRRHLQSRRLWAAYQVLVAEWDRTRRAADADRDLDDRWGE